MKEKLISLLKGFSNDSEFIKGIIDLLYNDKDKQTMIDFIEYGENPTRETIILFALDMANKRDENPKWDEKDGSFVLYDREPRLDPEELKKGNIVHVFPSDKGYENALLRSDAYNLYDDKPSK